jgi:hypothetical protein
VSDLVRALLLASLLALVFASGAAAETSSEFAGHRHQVIPVVVVHGMTLGDLPVLAAEGAAVGLLVPNAGPRTSQADAYAGMVRGILYNTRLPQPSDSVLIRTVKSTAIPRKGPAIVIGLPPATSAPNDRRYPIAILGAGYEQGVLLSDLTRVPGLVSMADVARTALRTAHALRYERDGGNVAAVYELDERVDVARSTTMLGSVLVLMLLIAAALFFPRAAPATMGSALAANLALGWMPMGDAGPRVALLTSASAVGGVLGARFLRGRTPLGLALVAVLAAYAVSMIVHPSSLSLAPMGPELTSRFFGVSNLLETLLLVPALLGARLVKERFGWLGFAAVGTLTLATISENRLGADGGGAVVVAVAFALLAVWMSGRNWRVTIPALGGAGLLVLGLLHLDAASSSPDHLRGALNGGLGGIANVAANRVPLAYARMLEQWYLVFPLVAAIIVCVAVVRSTRVRNEAAVIVSLLGALAASLLVNDSPGPVTIAGLAVVLSLEGGLLHRTLALPLLRRIAPPVAAARPQEP